ncbi:MAG: hydrogenase-4 component E [Acetobacteraceae bacterium]|nr:hydrogenase-4 component E [Acetobacteraceae bacterium]
MSFGPQDIGHLPGGAMLLISFFLLHRRRVVAVIGAFALQGAMLALAAAWQGWVQGAPQLYLVALIEAGAKAVVFPIALRRLLRRSGEQPAAEATGGVGLGLAAGIVLVGLAVLLMQPIGAAGRIVAREDLVPALSVLLLGLLLMVVRRDAVLQLVGLMSLESGAILAAVSLAGMPLVPLLSTAGLTLLGVALAGAFFRDGRRFAPDGERG